MRLCSLVAMCAPALLLAAPARARGPSSGPIFRVEHDTPPPGAPVPPHPVRLDYSLGSGTAACPSVETFRDAVSALTRFEPFEPSAAERLAVTVVRQGRLYQASAALWGAATAPIWAFTLGPVDDCRILVDSLAGTVANKIDPVSSPAPPPRATSAPLPPPHPPRDETPPPMSPPRAFRVRLGLGAAVELATVPSVAFGLTLDVGLRWDAFSIALEGRGDFPASGALSSAGRLRVYRFMSALVPCGHWLKGGWLFACGLVEFGLLRASSLGVDHPDASSFFGAAVGARLGTEIPLVQRRLVAYVAGDLLGTLVRAAVTFEDRPIWTAAPVSGAVGVGLRAAF
jgi:hypothetical protein